ncbi:MAG: 16S rRNA (guanine(527)-N(7))-methyltransferase RsmG [Defluviitaleaceae bacterium]|nr:16S rRNA (guanine(527)-N(7))-methyltransferase RsmG [Defluviitaleaceae bacterium]
MREIIEKWTTANGLKVTAEQYATLEAYKARVLEVNQHMNLTRITETADFAVKHVIDSLTLLPYIGQGASVIDIGTGAGFPGMVLKIMRNDIKLTLLDSLRKRVNFLQETADILNLPDIECTHSRAEDRAKTHGSAYDICTARAVASMDKLAAYALPLVKKGGLFLAMKGNDITEELENAKPTIKKHRGKVESVKSVKIVGVLTHTIVIIRKI